MAQAAGEYGKRRESGHKSFNAGTSVFASVFPPIREYRHLFAQWGAFMPNRILRAELLDSEAWLSLKDNADRAAFIACILTVDTFGDMPAGPHRLVRLWRPYGIDTPEKAAKVFGELIDVDLVRSYQQDAKPYLHIPRFQQSPRFPGHLWPLSPWASNEEKQIVAKKSPVTHGESPEGVEVGVGVGVGVEEDQKHVVPYPKVRARGIEKQVNTGLERMKVKTDKPPHMTREEQNAYVEKNKKPCQP